MGRDHRHNVEPFLFGSVLHSVLERLDPIQRDFRHVGVDLPAYQHVFQDRLQQAYPHIRVVPPSSQPVDVFFSISQAHWIGDLPRYLAQIYQRLRKPDGLVIVAFWGGRTLQELRDSLLQVEIALTGGAHGRVIPMIDPSHGGMLLQKAGFVMPVIDCEVFTGLYPDLKSLIQNLRKTGETDPQNRPTPRNLFQEAEKYYRQHYAKETGELSATFELVTLTGWSTSS